MLLPDRHNRIELTPERVRRLCDRRAGIGGDGAIRIGTDPARPVRHGLPQRRRFARRDVRQRRAGCSPASSSSAAGRRWSRSSSSPAAASAPLLRLRATGSRSGWVPPSSAAPRRPRCSGLPVGRPTHVGVDGRCRQSAPGRADRRTGRALDLATAPTRDDADFPTGVNIEFVNRTGERAVRMRVHERGSGRPGPAAPARWRWRPRCCMPTVSTPAASWSTCRAGGSRSTSIRRAAR